jgi:DNA-binding MarR family transcriptional regulator
VPATTATIDAARLASRLRVSVTRLARKLRREGDPDVTPTLLSALATIERHGPMTAGALADHEQVRKPTATRVIALLIERGLAERTPDPLDGRIAWLRLSTAGRRYLQGIRRRKDLYLSEQMKRLSLAEMVTLEAAAEILDRLTEGGRVEGGR